MASFLSTLFGGGAEKEAANKNNIIGQVAHDRNMGFLDTGLGKSSGYLTNALGSYDSLANLASQYRGASDLYMNALGVNGADAARTAQQSFTNNPGYEAAIDAGMSAINRRRAAGGMLGSGNADLDALKYGQNLQNQQYGSWLDRLSGLNQNALAATGTAAAGQAGAYGALSDLYGQDAANRIGVTNGLASGMMQGNQQIAQGQASGARNLLGAGMSLASLAMGGMGGGFGFGGGLGAGSIGSAMNTGLGGMSSYSIGYGGQNMPVFGRPY